MLNRQQIRLKSVASDGSTPKYAQVRPNPNYQVCYWRVGTTLDVKQISGCCTIGHAKLMQSREVSVQAKFVIGSINLLNVRDCSNVLHAV